MLRLAHYGRLLAFISLFITNQAYAATVPELAGKLHPNAIWRPPQNDYQTIFKACGNKTSEKEFLECELEFMRNTNASPQALAFTNHTRGWIVRYKKYRKLTVIYAFVPGADHSDKYFILNKRGELFDIDDSRFIHSIDLSQSPLYNSIISRYPNASIWFGNHQFPKVKRLPKRGRMLIFTYRLANGCTACETAGYAQIGFKFDRFTNLQGVALIKLMSN